MGKHHFDIFRDTFCKSCGRICDRMAKDVPVIFDSFKSAVSPLVSVDSHGRRKAMDRQFTLISRLPSAFEIVTAVQNSGLSLAWTTAGNGLRYRVFRNVAGQYPQLIVDGLSDLAAQVNLPLGLNELFVEAYDHIGNKSNSQTLRVHIKNKNKNKKKGQAQQFRDSQNRIRQLSLLPILSTDARWTAHEALR